MRRKGKAVEGSILGENSHYRVDSVGTNGVCIVTHLGTNTKVNLSKSYIEQYCTSASVYDESIKVTREDSSTGEGIRTIFENIPAGDVFTVTFRKQVKPLSKKAIKERVSKIVSKLDTPSGITDELIREGLINPQGELRTLVGWKLKNYSRDGKYDCLDTAISEVRPVNINTIEELVYKGTRYALI